MKGLLLKDYRMTLYYCRRYFLIALIFSGVFLGTGQTGVAVPYHTIVVAGIITTLLSYDERSGWDQYVSTLPCTRGQVVGSKYLMTLALQPALLGVQALVLMARNLSLGNPLLEGWEVLLLMLGVSMALVAIILPCLFWRGVERGGCSITWPLFWPVRWQPLS